jgi:uncharacterized protein with HEPN domain
MFGVIQFLRARRGDRSLRSIDQDIIWDILQNKLPTLATQIERILENLDSQPQDTAGR